jgi:hypothetical protein
MNPRKVKIWLFVVGIVALILVACIIQIHNLIPDILHR